MNLDELRSVQSKERQKDSLQHLRPSFYQEVGEYIAELEDERDRVAEQADDPFSSPEVGRLTDEIETAKDVVEAIYERRMGKLVKQSSLAAAGMPADDEGLTAEEADLFDDLVDRISSNKSRVLDVLEGVEDAAAANAADGPGADGTDATSPDSTPTGSTSAGASSDPVADPDPAGSPSPTDATDDAPPVPPEEPPMDDGAMADSNSSDSSATTDSNGSSGVTPADVMGGDGPDLETSESDPDSSSVPADDPASEPAATDSEPGAQSDSDSNPQPDSESAPDAGDVDRVTVKITRDIGSILGVDDREYSLSSDDIVTLPEQNATPLLEQEAAEPLE